MAVVVGRTVVPLPRTTMHGLLLRAVSFFLRVAVRFLARFLLLPYYVDEPGHLKETNTSHSNPPFYHLRLE